ncbi:potassium channel protein [Novipirellula caenicola]
MPNRHQTVAHRIAAHSAPAMFWISLAFLVCQSVLVVLWVDVPNMEETLIRDPVTDETVIAYTLPPISRSEIAAIAVMLLIWPIVIAESIYHWYTRPWDAEHRWTHLYSLAFCLCPSLRMCARSVEMGNRIWLPTMGWRKADARLRRRLERYFSVPMIWIALLIMPVLLIELLLKNQVAQYGWLRFALHFSTGAIWFCFAAEFILMVSVAEKKIAYCKTHWLDLAIILLPLVSFLRSLQFLRATGITKMVRLSQINQVARMYRLRGTALKAVRALVLLDMLERILRRSPERSLEKLYTQLEELETEAKAVRRKIAKLEREMPVEMCAEE